MGLWAAGGTGGRGSSCLDCHERQHPPLSPTNWVIAKVLLLIWKISIPCLVFSSDWATNRMLELKTLEAEEAQRESSCTQITPPNPPTPSGSSSSSSESSMTP